MRIGSEARELGPERASGVAFGVAFGGGFRNGALVEFFVCDGGLFLRGYDFFDDYMLKKS